MEQVISLHRLTHHLMWGVLTGYNELTVACTVMLAVIELVSATAAGVVIQTVPPDVNVLHNILCNISLLCNVSVDSS